MKKALMVIMGLSLLLMAGSAFAQTVYTYPADKPVFSITFPEKWKVELDAEDQKGMTAMSPDEAAAIEFDIWPVPEDKVKEDVKAAINEEIKGIDEVIAQWVTDAKFGDAKSVTINEIEFYGVDGTGKDKESGKDTTVSVDFFTPDGKTLFVLLYWGTPDAEKTYEKELIAIVQSIKKP